MRSVIDRVVGWLARLVALGFYRSVEVVDRDMVPRRGPVLVVSNHFNGMVDAVVVASTLRRLPRFIAKSTLWKFWPARPFLALAGVVPIHRRVDGGGDNRSSFHVCHEVLAHGHTIAIFPEGTTHFRPHLDPIRTGAARIALGAVERGVRGLVILPIGLAFEDLMEVRSRALVRVGRPIDLDAEMDRILPRGAEAREEDRSAVQALNDELTVRLRAVSPDYVDVREQGTMRLAAEVSARVGGRVDGGFDVPLAMTEPIAQCLARRPDTARREVERTVAAYVLDLRLAHLRDEHLDSSQGFVPLLGRLVLTTALVMVLFPVAVLGTVANLVPALAVYEAGVAIRAPVTKGTVRLLVALIIFPVTWIVLGIVLVDGIAWGIALWCVMVAGGLLAVWLVHHVRVLARLWAAWWARRVRAFMVGPLVSHRRDVAEAVDGALAGVEPAGTRPAGIDSAGRDSAGIDSAGRESAGIDSGRSEVV